MPKKPKLTPEQKRALRIQMKAEKKRLAELLKRQQRHDHLSREIKYGKLTHKLHEKQWREMLIRISLPKMRSELTLAWHNFERIIDSKDFTISLLMDEIRDAEEQYMLNLKCHSENIDGMITMFYDRLSELKAKNENEITFMQASAEEEVQDLLAKAADSEERLKIMLYGLEMARKEQEKLVRGDYLSKIDEETTKYNDILQQLRAFLEKSFSDLWDKTKTFVNEYHAQTADRRKKYFLLKQQDDNLQELCGRELVKLNHMREYINKLKRRYEALHEAQSQKITDLEQERQYFADAFSTLRIRLENDRVLDENNLTVLTEKSNQAMKYLGKLRKKGEHLLELAAICRKFETHQEKILPFPITLYQEERSLTSRESIKMETGKHLSNLQLFWQRLAQADAVRFSMKEERDYLKLENKKLKQKIHQYCLCIDCPEFLPIQTKASPRRINRIDGNCIERNYKKHL